MRMNSKTSSGDMLGIKSERIECVKGNFLGVITLSAPKSLNALTVDMISQLAGQLAEFISDDHITCVVLKGAGDKAFCAGGDIRQLYHEIKKAQPDSITRIENFFMKEYKLDYLIHKSSKPIIGFGSGIVMGGGLGLFSGCSHRIVTKNSRLAMPEIAIGLFPDVGASWFLNRIPNKIGQFLGMTGAIIGAVDAIFLGLADYCIPENKLKTLIAALLELDWSEDQAMHHDQISHLLKLWAVRSSLIGDNHFIQSHFDALHYCMDEQKPSSIVEQLKTHCGHIPEIAAAIQKLEKGAPLSVCLVMEQLKRAKHFSLGCVFEMEFSMVQHAITTPDLIEGIRALLIDKTYDPVWQFSSLDAVPSYAVNAYFEKFTIKDKKLSLTDVL